jgi:hypothetical protein
MLLPLSVAPVNADPVRMAAIAPDIEIREILLEWVAHPVQEGARHLFPPSGLRLSNARERARFTKTYPFWRSQAPKP